MACVVPSAALLVTILGYYPRDPVLKWVCRVRALSRVRHWRRTTTYARFQLLRLSLGHQVRYDCQAVPYSVAYDLYFAVVVQFFLGRFR